MNTPNAIDTSTKRKPGRPLGSKGKRTPRSQLTTRAGLRISEFAAAMGISRSAVLSAIERGEVRSTKIGGSRIIPATEMDRLLGTATAK